MRGRDVSMSLGKSSRSRSSPGQVQVKVEVKVPVPGRSLTVWLVAVASMFIVEWSPPTKHLQYSKVKTAKPWTSNCRPRPKNDEKKKNKKKRLHISTLHY